MRRRPLFGPLASVASLMWLMSTAVAAPPSSLSDLEKIDQYQRVIDATNKLEAILDVKVRTTTLACMRAFGHLSMCKCLADKLPVAISFNDYIAVTTRTKEENGYAKLDKETKAAYDRAALARDTCVRESIK